MMLKRPYRVVPFFLLLLFCSSIAAQVNVVVYQGNGLALLNGVGLIGAKRLAIDRASLDAVFRASKDILAEKELQKFFPILNDTILADWEKYVQGYEIQKERHLKGTYQVELQVRIFQSRLQADILSLAQLQPKIGPIMVLAIDPLGEDVTVMPEFQSLLEAEFNQQRFTFADREVRQTIVDKIDLDDLPLGKLGDLTAAANKNNQQYVILAQKLDQKNGCPSMMSLTVLDAKTAELVLKKSYRINRRKGGCSETMQSACTHFAELLSPVLEGGSSKSEPEPASKAIEVVAKGFKNFGELELVREMICDNDKVQDCRLIQAQPGAEVSWQVNYDGTAGQLRTVLHKKRSAGVELSVEAVSDSLLKIVIARYEVPIGELQIENVSE